MWTHELETGPDDEGLWTICAIMKDGCRVGEVIKESDAKAICDAMNISRENFGFAGADIRKGDSVYCDDRGKFMPRARAL